MALTLTFLRKAMVLRHRRNRYAQVATLAPLLDIGTIHQPPRFKLHASLGPEVHVLRCIGHTDHVERYVIDVRLGQHFGEARREVHDLPARLNKSAVCRGKCLLGID